MQDIRYALAQYQLRQRPLHTSAFVRNASLNRLNFRQLLDTGDENPQLRAAQSHFLPTSTQGAFTTKIRANAEVDIGILTIREDEFAALLEVFPKDAGIFKGRREYTLRQADTANGQRYTIALLRQVEQGNGEAQDAARDMIDDLSPSLLLVVGIAGGLPSDDYTLGDVVVATRVNDFSVEARKTRSTPTYNLSGGPIEKGLAAGVANLQGRLRDLGRWTKHLPAKPKVSTRQKDIFYGPAAWRRLVEEKVGAHFGRKVPARPPTFIAGAIASSDKLIKDPRVLFPWIQSARHLLAVEMESGGVYRAARERCPMLAIRGISDIVGLKRADAWTKYACAAAAAFTRAYLRTEPVNPKTTTQKRSSKPRVKAELVEPKQEDLFVNMVKLDRLPETVYVAPALCSSLKQGWAMLLQDNDAPVSNAWILYEKNIYSFVNPSDSNLSQIMDVGSVETWNIQDLFESGDPKKQRLLTWLIKGALRDDLRRLGIRFFPHDDVYAFLGFPDEPDKSYTYDNLRMQSSITVVTHYETESKVTGKKSTYLRHLAFRPHFRRIGDSWFLEITPSYIFTFDGKRKDFFHEQKLSGIKRLEGNRAVLSQILLWSHVLCRKLPNRWLEFSKVPPFQIAQTVSDGELVSVDEIKAPNVQTKAPRRRTSDRPSEVEV